MADVVLFDLDAASRWRLAYDDRQLIIQKHRPASGKTTAVAFVATHKRFLLDLIREKGVALSAEAVARLDVLPDSFREFAARPKISAAQARKPVLGTRTPETSAPTLHAA
jgi:hypothetical protein